MSRTLPLVVLLAAWTLLASSCSWNRGRVNVPDFPAKVASIGEGSSVDDLVAAVGNPLNLINLQNGKQLYVYSYGQTKTNGLTLIIFNISKTNVAMDTAFFVVNQGVVEEAFVGTNSEDVPWEFWAFGD